MKYFFPNGCEFTAHSKNDEPPAGLIALHDDHPHCTGVFDRATHYIDYKAEGWPLVAYTSEEIAARDTVAAEQAARDAFKAARAEAVANIRVTVNDNTFDGDETAQARMLSAINAATVLGSPVIPLWVLADNTVVRDLPVDDLKQAHALAVVAMAEVWLPE